jgi:hypothetical protein
MVSRSCAEPTAVTRSITSSSSVRARLLTARRLLGSRGSSGSSCGPCGSAPACRTSPLQCYSAADDLALCWHDPCLTRPDDQSVEFSARRKVYEQEPVKVQDCPSRCLPQQHRCAVGSRSGEPPCRCKEAGPCLHPDQGPRWKLLGLATRAGVPECDRASLDDEYA